MITLPCHWSKLYSHFMNLFPFLVLYKFNSFFKFWFSKTLLLFSWINIFNKFSRKVGSRKNFCRYSLSFQFILCFWRTAIFTYKVTTDCDQDDYVTEEALALGKETLNPICLSLIFELYILMRIKLYKVGGKVIELNEEGGCYSAPDGPNDLKFCMEGTFVHLFWFLSNVKVSLLLFAELQHPSSLISITLPSPFNFNKQLHVILFL